MTMQEFIRSSSVNMTSERVQHNPNMDGSDKMDNWRCVLVVGPSRMTVYFSMGLGLQGEEPKVGEVLDCLASDASSVANSRDLDDWANDLGYNPDSRKAERTYKTIRRQAAKLRKLLGDSAYETLLWDTDRL